MVTFSIEGLKGVVRNVVNLNPIRKNTIKAQQGCYLEDVSRETSDKVDFNSFL